MTKQRIMGAVWPDLPGSWTETYATLHACAQIVGKISLAQAPPLNHCWSVALQLTARGLTTRPLPHGDRTFTIEFDFSGHQLVVTTSDGITRGKPDPEIYLKAIDRLGARPEETIVLEDSANGARAGKNAGAYTIAVPSSYTRTDNFDFADYRASDLIDAKRHLQTLLRVPSD